MCCAPLLQGQAEAESAEQLMRSRYTAFATKNVDYLYETYAGKARRRNAKAQIRKGMEGVEWFKLEITAIHEGRKQHKTGEVAFVAYYRKGNQEFTLRERSYFIREKGKWKYARASR